MARGEIWCHRDDGLSCGIASVAAAGLSSLHLDRDAYEVRLVPQAKSGSRRADYQLPGRPFPQFDLGLAAFTRFQLVHGDSADVAPVVDFEFAFFFQ